MYIQSYFRLSDFFKNDTSFYHSCDKKLEIFKLRIQKVRTLYIADI